MKKEELATHLNNIQYPVRLDPVTTEAAKESNLVIVYGASDDLMEFDGAVHDEVGCYNGGLALIDSEGLLPFRDDIDDDDELELYFARRKSAKELEALWCKEEGVSWTYNTSIPHATFDVKEDDEIYCRGIVFDLKNI